jgi:hypothetical protein
LDETMIKQRGVHPAVRSMTRKPIKVGFKAFAIATVRGFTLEHRLYAGKTGVSGVGMIERVVQSILDPYKGRYHIAAMDSYYTHPKLFEDLLSAKLLAVGSINPTRRLFATDLVTAKPANDAFETRQLVPTPAVIAIVHANYTTVSTELERTDAIPPRIPAGPHVPVRSESQVLVRRDDVECGTAERPTDTFGVDLSALLISESADDDV